MENEFFIKPAIEGLIVRDPASRLPLAAAGETKPRSKYWLSRFADGEVIEVTAAPAKADKKTAAVAAEGDK